MRALLLPNTKRWKSLMTKSQSGCHQSYRKLLSDFEAWIPAIVAESQRKSEDADDLICGVLLAVHKKLCSCDPDQPILPWLVAVSDYHVSNHRRELQRH